MDAVKVALALPQPDPQDRLRVLAVAANVVSPIDLKLAKRLRRQGVRIESELVRLGKTPAMSLLASGQADCASAEAFLAGLTEDFVVAGEQSLIGVITSCKKETLEPVARLLDAGLKRGIVAPRALMATMQAMGAKSQWSQDHFQEMFASLPDAKENGSEAENFAAMYARMSSEMDRGVAQKTGVQLLDWLSQVDDSALRTVAINITSGAMKHALGEKDFQDALSSDVVAGSVVRNAQSGPPPKIERAPIESASVLQAMKHNGNDQSNSFSDLPPSTRAREAAAHGFASGTAGDKQQASKYFDVAFSAADEVWDARTPEKNAAAVVEEVSEAAAEVDPVNALMRARELRDSSAQAIAMLAVARVVAGTGLSR